MVQRIKGKESAGIFLAATLLLCSLPFFMAEKVSTAFCVSAVIFAVMGWLCVMTLCDDIRIQWLRGETACQEREDTIVETVLTFLTQGIVDQKLRELATTVERSFQIQTHLDEDQDEAQLEEVGEIVRKAKENFWNAHALAKSLGFKVRDKIKNYTTEW